MDHLEQWTNIGFCQQLRKAETEMLRMFWMVNKQHYGSRHLSGITG
jgi:hypothetical protein